MLILLATILQSAPSDPRPPYIGRERQIAVAVPRMDTRVTVDGSLDEPVWADAALLTGFSQFRPVDGRPAEDSTQVLVWYAPSAIYFGIRAFEAHGGVIATLADRDRIANDDYLQIMLDTFNDRRRALVFGVNPLGVQSDGIRSEGGGGAGGPGSGGTFGNFDNVDLNPDFVYESRGRVTEYGFEIEVRIPFESVRYQSVEPMVWGLNLLRKVQHSQYEDTWTPAVRASASFLIQSGTLQGMTDLRRGLVLDVNPFTTAKMLGSSTAAGWSYHTTPEAGVNARFGLTSNLTLDGTFNPDFSQVEADVGQVTVNERFAVFVPEKRPFFLEGIEQFDTPNQLIYMRRILNPEGGLKLTGKTSGTNIGILATLDDTSASGSGSHPFVGIARIRRDLKGNSTAGIAYTDRIDGDDYNRVAAVDARFVFGRMYYAEFQAGGSATRTGGVTGRGPIWRAVVDRTGRKYGFHYQVIGIHPDFRALNGFVPRTGIVSPAISNRFTTYGSPGAALETFTTFATFSGVWNYTAFFDAASPQEFSVSTRNSFTFRGGWGINANPRWQTVAFDPAFYSGYRVARAAGDTAAFTVPGRVTNAWDLGLTVSTPQLRTFSAEFGGNVGKTVAFFEPSRASALNLNANIEWRPTDKVRINALYNHLRLTRERDGTRLSTANIPRLRIEYQVARSVFIRMVGQYDAQERDALRDPATDEPILLTGSSGTPQLAARQAENDLRVDALFSFRPNPGTVLFAGYGSGFTETDAFTFRDVRRTEDGFFFKLSYLFRL